MLAVGRVARCAGRPCGSVPALAAAGSPRGVDVAAEFRVEPFGVLPCAAPPHARASCPHQQDVPVTVRNAPGWCHSYRTGLYSAIRSALSPHGCLALEIGRGPGPARPPVRRGHVIADPARHRTVGRTGQSQFDSLRTTVMIAATPGYAATVGHGLSPSRILPPSLPGKSWGNETVAGTDFSRAEPRGDACPTVEA